MPCKCVRRMDILKRHSVMRRFPAILVVLAALGSASPALADARSDAKSQVAFGINVAQRGLWREAIYRWEKAIELDPNNAEVRQNFELFKEINDRTGAAKDKAATEKE